MAKVKIVEVGMRDGLQNEPAFLVPKDLQKMVQLLLKSGHRFIEAGSFVSPKWVPQMSGSKDLLTYLVKKQKSGAIKKIVRFSALTPNLRGAEDAIACGVKEVAVFGAASEGFSQKNINCSIKESLTKFKEVIAYAKTNRVLVRGYISTVFACPYDGKTSALKVARLIDKYLDMGVYEVSLGDTIGAGTPKQVRDVLKHVRSMGVEKQIAMHFHDTRGTALANTLAGLDAGITNFDASIGGLGGCPYAKGASGNVATEDMVYMLESMGVKTGLSLPALVKTTKWLEEKLGHQLPSKISRSQTTSKL